MSKKPVDKDTIINYAKDLYFKKNSFREIAKKISDELKESYSYITIKNWSDKYGWRAMRDLAQARGVVNSKSKKTDDSGQLSILDEDEKVIAELSKDTAKQYKESRELRNIGLNLARISGVKEINGRQDWDRDFCPRKLTAAVNLFKAASEDMRKLEELMGTHIRPEEMSDEELDAALRRR